MASSLDRWITGANCDGGWVDAPSGTFEVEEYETLDDELFEGFEVDIEEGIPVRVRGLPTEDALKVLRDMERREWEP